MVALLAPFGKPQNTWAANRRDGTSLSLLDSPAIFHVVIRDTRSSIRLQLDPEYWSRPVDRNLDLWLWSDTVGCGSICIKLPT